MSQKTVAVVTSTIGRPELIRTIESVRAQTYPCKHYIFVDGEQFHDEVRKMVQNYSNSNNIIITYLPMNTGADGWMNSFINAAAPFLIKEDIICYLDDDNWYDPNHVAEIAHAFNTYPIDMAFNLRRLYDHQSIFIADDNMESLGFWFANDTLRYIIEYKGEQFPIGTTLHRTHGHIDVNCFAFLTKVARETAELWTKIGYGNDHQFLQSFLKMNFTSMCTGKRTVNYIVNIRKFMNIDNFISQTSINVQSVEDEILLKTQMIKGVQSCAPQEKPWLKPTIYQNGQLYTEK